MTTQKLTPTIRLGNVEDARLLAELGAQTFHDTFAADNTPEDMAAYLTSSFSPEKQAAELVEPGATFFIAELDGAVAGYAHLRPGQVPVCVTHPRSIELVRLYVTRDWFGRGVGEALMEACVGAARQAGFQSMWLGVWERNGRAQAFYRKWDFQVVGQHVFQVGSDPQTDLLMERDLS
ncbi:MAG: GNAT family N-acetyltransferase [Acidobacteriia bacterium]|nr:GNAT family N-acetyltransferase [Terriglobia bacterium]